MNVRKMDIQGGEIGMNQKWMNSDAQSKIDDTTTQASSLTCALVFLCKFQEGFKDKKSRESMREEMNKKVVPKVT